MQQEGFVLLVERLMESSHLRRLIAGAIMVVKDAATAEDCVSDGFAALLQETAHGRITEESHARAFLWTAVRNKALDEVRRRARAHQHLPKFLPEDLPGADIDAIDHTYAAVVWRAVEALPARQREIVTLRYFAGLSVAEVAATLGVSEGHVTRTASDSRNALHRELEHLR